MRYLGLDLGSKTLGISISDKLGMIARSLTIIRHNEEYDKLILEIEKIIKEQEVDAIVLGYLEDERLTTKEATDILISNNTSRKKRKKVIDSMAATIILQSYLNRKGNK